MHHNAQAFKIGDKVQVVRWPEGGPNKLYKNGEIPGFENTFGGGMWNEIKADKEYTVLRINGMGVRFQECVCAWPSGMFELAKKAKREGFAMVAFANGGVDFNGELYETKEEAYDALEDAIENIQSFEECSRDAALVILGNPSVCCVTFEPLNV